MGKPRLVRLLLPGLLLCCMAPTSGLEVEPLPTKYLFRFIGEIKEMTNLMVCVLPMNLAPTFYVLEDLCREIDALDAYQAELLKTDPDAVMPIQNLCPVLRRAGTDLLSAWDSRNWTELAGQAKIALGPALNRSLEEQDEEAKRLSDDVQKAEIKLPKADELRNMTEAERLAKLPWTLQSFHDIAAEAITYLARVQQAVDMLRLERASSMILDTKQAQTTLARISKHVKPGEEVLHEDLYRLPAKSTYDPEKLGFFITLDVPVFRKGTWRKVYRLVDFPIELRPGRWFRVVTDEPFVVEHGGGVVESVSAATLKQSYSWFEDRNVFHVRIDRDFRMRNLKAKGIAQKHETPMRSGCASALFAGLESQAYRSCLLKDAGDRAESLHVGLNMYSVYTRGKGLLGGTCDGIVLPMQEISAPSVVKTEHSNCSLTLNGVSIDQGDDERYALRNSSLQSFEGVAELVELAARGQLSSVAISLSEARLSAAVDGLQHSVTVLASLLACFVCGCLIVAAAAAAAYFMGWRVDRWPLLRRGKDLAGDEQQSINL